jgi:UDP-2,4-diacetamido-2,4,6-trideoxy-beta-L-altropyranose hydrolase
VGNQSNSLAEETLLIRADANVAMGTGHVMRCLALAQAWQDSGGDAVFGMNEPLPSIGDRLLSEGMEVVPVEALSGSREDAGRTAELASDRGAAWIVVDGYHFDADYQRELKAAGLQVLFVDDNGHASHYAADLILNQNVYADESLYPGREPYTRLLLGSRYVLLRREFRAWQGWKRVIPAVGHKVLVSMGGSDSGNVTAAVIPALQSVPIDGLEVTVVAGAGNPHLESLEAAIRSCNGSFRLVKDAVNMPELMAWADVMLAAAGTICWEICAMGLPSLLVVTAANQRRAADRLAALGAARTLDSGRETIATAAAPILLGLIQSQSSRESLSSKARELVDLAGAARVVSVLRGLSEPNISEPIVSRPNISEPDIQ